MNPEFYAILIDRYFNVLDDIIDMLKRCEFSEAEMKSKEAVKEELKFLVEKYEELQSKELNKKFEQLVIEDFFKGDKQ